MATTNDPHGIAHISVGTPIRAADGELLGHVREVQPHYLLVARAGQHADFDVPVHAIVGFADGTLQVSINSWSTTEVDDAESAHRALDEE